MSKIKKVFRVLDEEYEEQYAWQEVQEVLEEESQDIEIDESALKEAFKNLIIGVLSQNTSDRNSTKAFIGLKKTFSELTPEIIAQAKVSKIKKAIKPGGLYNVKGKRIKKLAKYILKHYQGDLTNVTDLSKKKAENELLKMPGVGQKTADVFLSECLNYGTIAVDTHIDRVAKRLGIVEKGADYDKIKEKLENDIEEKNRQRTHELLIRLGRDYCKARSPLCDDCPVEKFCDKNI